MMRMKLWMIPMFYAVGTMLAGIVIPRM